MHYTRRMSARIFRLAPLLLLLSVACSPMGKTGNILPSLPPPVSQLMISPLPPPAPPSAHIHFGRIGLEAGLSQSSVMAILQDRLGFMWFGTEDGLNRYDGEDFKVFRPLNGDPTSISDVWISTLELDADGAVWVGTRQGGVNRYDSKTGTFTRYQHQADVVGSLSHNYIHDIFSDTQGRLWFGTELGLDLFDPQSDRFEHFLPTDIPEFAVQAIAQDSLGFLWLGTSAGLWRFDPLLKEFSNYKISGNSPLIFDILVDSDNKLWLASHDAGLIHFDPQGKTSKQFLLKDGISFNNVRRLWFDISGKIWVGTAYGLNLFNPSSGVFIKYLYNPNISTSLSQDLITSLYQDRSGILWIGTYSGSLSIYDPQANKFAHYYSEQSNPNSLSDNIVFSFSPSPGGKVWLATFGGGLDLYNPSLDTFTHYRHDSSNPKSLRSDFVNYVLHARDGSVWVGTESGLDRLDLVTGLFSHFPSDINDPTALPGEQITVIYQDNSDTIWVGTNRGLARYNASTQTFSSYLKTGNVHGLNDSLVSSILVDHTGALWVGTFSGGLSRLEVNTGTFKHYRHNPQTPGSISNDSILGILESRDNTLWVGTAGGGLNRFDSATDTFTIFDDTDGLPNNIIYGILEDEASNLWLSTNFGIACFDPQTNTTRNFTVADGLQSNEFNAGAYAKDSNGSMYFGGINGFNIFNPSTVNINRFIPPISLVSVTQNGIPLIEGQTPESIQEINLKYPNNSFEFEFSALNYSQSNKNQYAYKLQGYDTNWYYSATNRSGRYSNLPGGDYALLLKASNSDGIWNETGLAIKVTVTPPFWKTWWFYGTTALIFLSAVVGTYQLRVYGIETQKRQLERQVAERTLEIEQLFEKTKDLAIVEERNRLARELHDSAKQKAFAALAQLGAANGVLKKDPKAARNHLIESENLVYEVIEELTFLIQEMYPVALKETGLAATLREYIFEWEGRTDIQVDVRIDNERRLSLDVEQAIYRIVQEALSNVSRHSHANHVEVGLSYLVDKVAVIIADNGCGFNQETTPVGVGLRSIRERIESLGGVVEITSLPDCGTRVTVNLPV
jgi:signal transduction histidine kinase/ligand-binding sensor domain-containing protein